MSKFTNNKSRGFTIVELLIVIVVIAILAAISIVAYNGIQDRARNTTAKEAAAQLASKVEVWKSLQGDYPDYATVKTNKLVATEGTEAEIEQDLADKITAAETTAPSSNDLDKPIQYNVCEDDVSSERVGVVITYWQTGGNDTISRGTTETGVTC